MKKIPAIQDENQYATQWRNWWEALQPDWRTFDEDGRLEQVGSGEWGALDHPGKNGVLMVLLSLMWWQDIATSQTLHDWNHAARDVAWTIWQMAMANDRYVCSLLVLHLADWSPYSKRSADDEREVSRPSKKTRR